MRADDGATRDPGMATNLRATADATPPAALAYRISLSCLVAGTAWVLLEVGGGLAFLHAGVRLWRYRTAPILEDITSPVVWIFAVTLIVPLSLAFDHLVALKWRGAARAAVRLAFLMVTGSLLEVLINRFVFLQWFSQPLFEYTLLPTFGASGSWLSPLYYATLIVHVPITDRLLGMTHT